MDEPTTGLDVTVEAAVLDLIATLRRKHKTSIVFISHNLGTVVRICDRIGVLYAGELVEEGPIRDVFRDPRHPYTRGLLSCLPTLDADKHSAPLVPIRGSVTVPRNRPPGCVFATRCEFKREGLRSEEHTSELQSLLRISYAVFCLTTKKKYRIENNGNNIYKVNRDIMCTI